GVAEGLGEGGLARSGEVFEQDMAVGEERNDDQVDDMVAPPDRGLEAGREAVHDREGFLGGGDRGGGFRGCGGGARGGGGWAWGAGWGWERPPPGGWPTRPAPVRAPAQPRAPAPGAPPREPPGARSTACASKGSSHPDGRPPQP